MSSISLPVERLFIGDDVSGCCRCGCPPAQEDDEGDDGIDREDGFVLMKDWSYAKWALFLILSLSTALGFIFTMVLN